jgi:amino acid transporter
LEFAVYVFDHAYKVEDEEVNVQRIITGAVGTFFGEWFVPYFLPNKPDIAHKPRTGIIKAIFSYTGMDIFAATAAEYKALGDAESMKMAARKIIIRIVTIYCFAVFTASFVVPYNHPFLDGSGQSVSAGSIFIIAVVEAGCKS